MGTHTTVTCAPAEDSGLLSPLQSLNWVKVSLISTVVFLPVSIEPWVEMCFDLSAGDRILCLRGPAADFCKGSTREDEGGCWPSRQASGGTNLVQSLEWNSPLYINFTDYEKASDSVDRETMWKLLKHYGVPKKIISLIQCTYQDMSFRIAHAGRLSKSFEVKTGVRQGCLLSPFFFLLVIDWIVKITTTGRNNGIQWTL